MIAEKTTLDLEQPPKKDKKKLAQISLRRLGENDLSNLRTIDANVFNKEGNEEMVRIAVKEFIAKYLPLALEKVLEEVEKTISKMAANLPYKTVLDIVEQKDKIKLLEIKKLCIKTQKDKVKANQKAKK